MLGLKTYLKFLPVKLKGKFLNLATGLTAKVTFLLKKISNNLTLRNNKF